MTVATTREQMTDILTEQLEDGMVVCTGVNSLIPLAACMLAKQTHAPNLTILAGGVFVNPGKLAPEFCAGWDLAPEYAADMTDLYAFTEIGIDAVFFSGLQIDRYGNINMHRVRRPDGPDRRGPGIANTSFGHTARQVFLWTEHHDRRQLRPDVDFYSIVGHNMRGVGREELGLENAGPQILVTPDAVFRPQEDGVFQPAIRLGERAWVEVMAATGWEISPEPPARRAPMDADRLEILRNVVDPAGLLRSNK